MRLLFWKTCVHMQERPCECLSCSPCAVSGLLVTACQTGPWQSLSMSYLVYAVVC